MSAASSEACLTQSPFNKLATCRAKRAGALPVPLRWKQVLDLHLSGRRPAEIMALTGYSPAMYYRILASPQVLALRQRMMEGFQKDFEALWPKVIDNIRDQLDDPDAKIQIAAQHQFFKATGRFAPPKSDEVEKTTASDVVKQLLAQQVNVTVNIGGQPQGGPPCGRSDGADSEDNIYDTEAE